MRAISLTGFAALTAGLACAQLTAVDIRPSAPNTIPEMRSRFFRGHYELKNATLADLIDTAWAVDADKVIGGPDWLDTDRFDVTATAPPGFTPDALRLMLRALLANRFHLVTRENTQARPAYAMTAVGKLQLKQAGADEKTGCETRQTGKTTVAAECRNMNMAALAKALPGIREAAGYLFDYPVSDRTGLTGAWDFTLQWTPRVAMRANPAIPDPVTIFDALEKQLGLKLSLTRIATRVVVVESVAEIKPTPTDKPPAPLEFEVADIKPDEFGTPAQCSKISIQPGGLTRIDMTLKGLISEAWGAMDPAKIVAGPKSIPKSAGETCFAILAKAPAEDGAVAGWNGPVWNGVDIHSMRMMLRALLVDRFKLAAHTEDRLIPGYSLLSTRSGRVIHCPEFTMRMTRVLSMGALVLACALTVGAQDAGRGGGRGGGRGRGGGGIPAPLKITIAAFSDGGTIPAKYGCAAGANANISPAIQWSSAPAGTATIALILHDPDVAIGGDDMLHWAIFNIPAAATGLPEGVPAKAMLDDGSVQINNIGGSIGYFNPCPPPPTTHHYMFEFYALDTKLDPAPTSRADLLKAMNGHIRAKGVYFGLFHQ